MSRPQLAKSPESERAFIGSLLRLVNEEKFDIAHEAAFAIEPDDFHDDQFKSIFSSFRRLLQSGEPFDHTLLVAECNGSVEHPAYLLLEAGESVATSAHIDGYSKVIRSASLQRRAVCIVQDASNELRKTTDPTATITKLRTKLDKIMPAKMEAAPITTEAYTPFPIDVLPAVVGNYVDAASHAIGCDPAFIALPLLGCAGSCDRKQANDTAQKDVDRAGDYLGGHRGEKWHA